MNWLLPRLLAGVLAMLAGGVIGFAVSNAEQTLLWRVLVGGGAGVAIVALLDTLRGYRLINWLRGSQDQQAPRDAGFWGELGYRVERLIRLREQGTMAAGAAPAGAVPRSHRGFTEWRPACSTTTTRSSGAALGGGGPFRSGPAA